MTTHDEKVERLAAILAELGSDVTFTERQTETRGPVRTDRETDGELRRVIDAMRDRYAFETSLTDDQLVCLVRGYYRGTTDDRLATDLGVDAATIVEARLALHLVRPSDLDVPFDPEAFREMDAEGATDDDIARALGTDGTTVRPYRAALDARREARRVSYRYPAEFAAILDVDNEALADVILTDRRLMDLVTQ